MTDTRTFRILVVDESPAVPLFIQLAVGSEVVRVVGATDGHSALDAVDQTRPDLVLAAAEMTGLGGRDLAAKLSSRKLPLVLMKGSLDRTRDRTGAGATVLTKPLQVGQLRDLVRQMTNGQLNVAAAPEVDDASDVRSAPTMDAIEAWLDYADAALSVPRRWR
jgi:CheY-like chemotaxis protein